MVRQHAAEKVRVLETLERLEKRRNQMFAAAGWWGTAPEASRIADRWHALMELIANCRAANELNGYIIHVRQNQIRQLMDIVRGCSARRFTGRREKPLQKRCGRSRKLESCWS